LDGISADIMGYVSGIGGYFSVVVETGSADDEHWAAATEAITASSSGKKR
jgi:hypothetical protein